MELPVHGAQKLTIHVSVDLSSGDVRVTQHLLHRTKIRSAFQKVSRERVAERVRRNRLGDPCDIDVFAEDFPRTHPRQRLPASVEKEHALSLPTLELRPELP